MKKTLYRCNVNQVIRLSVDNGKALKIFTPRELGVPCTLVPKGWDIGGYYFTAERVDMLGNVQLEDKSVSVFSVDDIKS